MARCPRCLNPMDDERKCVDAGCVYRVEGSSLGPLWAIFVLVGIAHLALVWRFGVPVMEPPAPVMYWCFVAVCWLCVNSAATVAIYAAYVFSFELDAREFVAWAKRAVEMLRATARGADLPAAPSGHKKA